MTKQFFTYRVFDLLLNANLPIPGLMPIDDPPPTADLIVYLGEWPHTPDAANLETEPSHVGPFTADTGEPIVRIWSLADGSTLRVAYYHGPEFLLDLKSNRIWARWPQERPLEDAAAYLLGSVLGILLRSRGEICLHASAVSMEDAAVAFVGPPGAGKSTVAALFSCRGHAVLADDVVLLREREPGKFSVIPSHPLLSLWPESLELIERRSEELPRVFSNLEKRRLPLLNPANRFENRVLPLESVYVLGKRSSGPAPQVQRLDGHAALMSLVADTYANYVLDSQQRAKELETLARLASRVPVHAIHASEDVSRLGALCDLIRRDYRLRSSEY